MTRRGGGKSREDAGELRADALAPDVGAIGDGRGELDAEEDATVPARWRGRPGPDAKDETGLVEDEDSEADADATLARRPPPVKPLLLAASLSEISVDARWRPTLTVSSDARGPGVGDWLPPPPGAIESWS